MPCRQPPCMAALRTRADDIRPYGPGSCHTALQTARQGCRALRLRRGPRCHNHQSFSEARHRRRPGGPGRYSVAMIRACGVIDAGRPRRGSACHETQKRTGRASTPGSCFVCTAFRRHEPPYWGAPGGFSPGPFFPPFLREEMGAPAGQAPPYPSSSRSTCPAERAKSRAAARASWRVLPWVPTSTSTEPVDSCWLYREERMVMGRARVG